MELGPYGIIQGSNLSEILYSLYNNKILKLHNILFNTGKMREIFQREAFNRNNFKHEVTQLVDNSNGIIIISDRTKIMLYLNKYFQLLKFFYNLNKLKINDDKTSLMLINNPRHETEVKDTTYNNNKHRYHQDQR